MSSTTKFSFRPISKADLPMVREWLGRPHVSEWWGEQPSLAELEEDMIPARAGVRRHACFLAIVGATPIGFIQWYAPALWHDDGWWLEEDDPGVRGIDQFLANAAQLNEGLGTSMVRAFIAELFTDRSVTRIQTDPSPTNARAIRCYAKAGFRGVREVVTPDGPALLMYAERSAGSY